MNGGLLDFQLYTHKHTQQQKTFRLLADVSVLFCLLHNYSTKDYMRVYMQIQTVRHNVIVQSQMETLQELKS